MKRLFLLSLLILSSYTTVQAACWDAKIPIDPSVEGVSDELKKKYTSDEIVSIYSNIIMPTGTTINHLYNKQYMCSIIWPYFAFIMNGTYKQKEFKSATTVFIQTFGNEVFINRLNSVDELTKIMPAIKGFNGKDKPNDNPSAYEKFSSNPKNKVLVNLMNGNEALFISIKTYFNEDEKNSSLKDIKIDDLFGFLLYLQDKKYLDMEYLPEFDEYSKDLLSELSKIQN